MVVCKKILVCLSLLLVCLLAGCGAPLLSDREIVRAVFFEKSASGVRAVMLLEGKNAEKPAPETVLAEGPSLMQALQQAENRLQGDVFYGLMDLAVFTDAFSCEEIRSAGKELWDTLRPVPRIRTLLLDSEAVPTDWKQGTGELYEQITAGSKRAHFSSGLQQLFVQEKEYALPEWQGTGFGFVFLRQGREAVRYEVGLTAQLSALLRRQSDRLDCRIPEQDLRLRANATVQCDAQPSGGAVLRLTLRDIKLSSGSAAAPEAESHQKLENAVQAAFMRIRADTAADGFDPLRLHSWTFALDGSRPETAAARLELVLES